MYNRDRHRKNLAGPTATIVAAYIGRHGVELSALPELIAIVRAAIGESEAERAAHLPQKAAVPIEESVHPDYLVCLEDGRRFKMLRPHLLYHHRMSVEEYRERWKLRGDYPLVAPGYSERRSDMARDAGLGRQGYGRGRPRRAE